MKLRISIIVIFFAALCMGAIVNDNFKPKTTNTWDLGSSTYEFKDLHLSGDAYIDTLTLSTGSITDSTGGIDFNNENLETSGDCTFANLTLSTGSALTIGTTQWDDGSDSIDGEQIADDSIDDDSLDLVQEEQFGPIVPVMPFDDQEEAIHRANDTRYGLGASVWSRDMARAQDVARRLEAGVVWINAHSSRFLGPQACYGGVKESGIGVEKGIHGIEEYMHRQTVSMVH